MINHPTQAPSVTQWARQLPLFSGRSYVPKHSFEQCNAPQNRLGQLCSEQPERSPKSTAAYLLLAFLISSTFSFSPLLPTAAYASSDASPESSVSASTQAVIDRINQIRSGSGLSPLVLNPDLTLAAQNHAVDMVTHHHHSHTGTDGSSVRVRIERTGYGPGNRSSENWVALMDPAKAVDWWMASPPHRANILNPSWQEVGIGNGINPNTGLNYFVVVFASRGAGYTVAAPTSSAAAVNNSGNQAQLVSATLPDFHQVLAGESLSSIATRYGISWQSLATVNNLGEYSILSIGQTVALPSSGSRGASSANIGGPVGGRFIQNVPYIVTTGDTLFTIGIRFSIPWQDISAHNGISGNSVLSIDQVLQIPVDVSTLDNDKLDALALAPKPAVPATHVVQSGETIINIALQHNLNWKELLRLNGLSDSTLLAVGQTLALK